MTLPLFALLKDDTSPTLGPSAPMPKPTGCRRPSQRAFAAQLRDRGEPYVAVDDAKRAIFPDSKIEAFDFLVYRMDGPNFLVYLGSRNTKSIAAMMAWGETFGPDFLAVFARMNKTGDVRYVGLDGVDVAVDTT